MATNRLGIRNVRAVPNVIPNNGGTVKVQFEAVTTEGPATASVTYSVTSGFPFRVSAGGSSSPAVNKTEKTVPQNVTLARTQPAEVSFIQLDVRSSIPGDSAQTQSCFVWISDPIGTHLRNFRTERGLSRNEIAEQLGVSAATITRIEGGRFPSATLEEAIAGVIGDE